MIVHLGENVSVESSDIIAIVDLTRGKSMITNSMMREIRKQNRILSRKGIDAKSAVICGGARKAGGITENPRIYLTQISTQTIAQRTEKPILRGIDWLQQNEKL